MKVILVKDVPTLGKEGDVVSVSDGHAMNFLFPQSLAVQATDEALKKMAQKEKKASKAMDREMKEASKAARKLDGFELLVKAKVADSGKLYAALSPQMVADELKSAGFKVQKEFVKIKEAIKETGEFDVKIDFPHGFEANIKLVVEAK